jgi:hypothetical protein
VPTRFTLIGIESRKSEFEISHRANHVAGAKSFGVTRQRPRAAIWNRTFKNSHSGPPLVAEQEARMADCDSGSTPFFAKRLAESALAAFSVRSLEERRPGGTTRRCFTEKENPWADDAGPR